MTREEAHNYNVMKNLARKAAAEANKVGAEANHDAGDDDLNFAMLTPPTRPGPAKAATTPEVDPVERRREQALARMIAKHEASALRNIVANAQRAVEVRHGSGKVKV